MSQHLCFCMPLTSERCITENLIKMYLVDIFRFVLHTTVVRREAFVFWKLIMLRKFYVCYSYVDTCDFYRSCLGFRLLLSDDALGCQNNTSFELVHGTEFLITFQTADLMITVNSCLDVKPKEICPQKFQTTLRKIVWEFLFSLAIDSACFFHCTDWHCMFD